MRRYGSIPISFWPDEMPLAIQGNHLAIAMVAYLMSSPHSNMIGIYRLPIEYIRYDTKFSEESIRESLRVLEGAEFAFYDEPAKTIYIPSYAAIQVAPSLSPKDKRIPAIQRELDKTQHREFKRRFLSIYEKLFHLSPFEGASKGDPMGSQGAPKGHRSPSEGPPKPLKVDNSVDNQGASKGHRSPLVTVPVLVKGGLGGIDHLPVDNSAAPQSRRPPSKARQFFASWPDQMMSQSRKTN